MGVLPSTTVAFLQAEGGSVPAEARLNGRQEAFAIRLAFRDGPQERLLSVRAGLGSRLRDMVGIRNREEVEQVRCSKGQVFPGEVVLPREGRGKEEREEVARQAGNDRGRGYEGRRRYDIDRRVKIGGWERRSGYSVV